MMANKQALFIGKRLTEARTARGLTMTQLADMTGIKKQSISNYEKEKSIPKAEALLAITECLGVSLAFLQKEPITTSKAPVFFRSNAGLAKREWAKAEIKLGWFEELFSYLEESITFVPVKIPTQFDISSRLKKTTMEEIAEIAISVREFWGLGLGPISNVTRLLENNGIVIVKMLLDVKEEDAFSQWQRNDTLPVIVSVAESPSACRDRFTLAHELGHLILHRNVDQKEDNLKLLESQANYFASSFLLPASSYLKEFRYPNLEIFKLLKEKWRVSIKAQVYRCKDLGVISESAARNFYLSMAQRKWIRHEPLDNLIPIESPKIIKQAISLLLADYNISLEDIARETSLATHDIAGLCGIEENTNSSALISHSAKASSRVIPFRRVK